MGRRALKFKHKPVVLQKASSLPDFRASTVLVANPWKYVDLWLRREKHSEARFYWQQAEQFFLASRMLPATASPLPAYYCILNATKALLTAKGQHYGSVHGVSGGKTLGRKGLRAERVEFRDNGVLPALTRYLGEWKGQEAHSLYELLYNLPCIHRAFTVTYATSKELFIPVREPRFVVRDGSHECWFEAEVEPAVASGHVTQKLPTGFERDRGIDDAYIVRRTNRFQWTFTAADEKANLRRLCNYHHSTRKHMFYVYGSSRLWYLKRAAVGVDGYVEHTCLPIAYAAMHRLSELARYDPLALAKHLDARHNWLLTEFIDVVPHQFVDEIASELTGRDFMPPGVRSSTL